MLTELLQLALGNMRRARGRVLMTAGGVVVGTTAVILLVALTNGLQLAAEKGFGSDASLTQIDVYPNWSPDPSVTIPQLTLDAVRAFWQIPGVQVVIPSVMLQGGELTVGKYTNWVGIQGIDPALLPYLGLPLASGELALGDKKVLAGQAIQQNFYDPNSTEWQPIAVDFLETPPALRLWKQDGSGAQRSVKLGISAMIQQTGGPGDYAMYMDIQEVLELNEWITGQRYDPETFKFDQVVVRATNRETTNTVSEAIREMGFGAGGAGQFLNELNKFFDTMRLMLGAIGGVALIVAAFGVANTMMMAILERTREIGIMKAIGATDRDVLTVFLLEAGLVGLLGGVTGVGLSLLIQNLVNSSIQNVSNQGGMMFLPINPEQLGGNLLIIPGELVIFALLLATSVGVIAGIYPALRAANLPPVLALKQE